jgi:hypothetical protein
MELSNRQDLINALYDDETREAAVTELRAIIKTGEKLIKMKMYNAQDTASLRTRFERFHEEIAKSSK